MLIHLVQCASQEASDEWKGPGGARPLSEQGQHEALGLVDFLSGRSVERIVSGPQQSARETLAPLATDRGLPIHLDDRLDTDSSPEAALLLLQRLEEPAVVCAHGALVTALVGRLLGRPPGPELEGRREPGSVWLIEGDPPRATYFSPRRELGKTLPRLTRLRLQRVRRGRRADTSARVAVFELGSTALHLLVAEATAAGGVKRVARVRTPWRDGGALAGEVVSKEAIAGIVQSARSLRKRASALRPSELVAVGTAALREARNARGVADAAAAAFGAPVQVLSAREEARLVFQAIRGRMQIGDECVLGLDLGGGNLTLVVGDSDGVQLERTLPLGVARLHAELVTSDPPDAETLRALRLRIREQLEPQLEAIATPGATRAIGAGGTVRAVARFLASRDRTERVGARGVFVALPELAALGRELQALDRAARAELAGVGRRRAELLPLGVEILGAVLSLLRCEGFTLCDWGLREGIVLDTRRARAVAARRPSRKS